jgi:Flp pilus assembly protein TadB
MTVLVAATVMLTVSLVLARPRTEWRSRRPVRLAGSPAVMPDADLARPGPRLPATLAAGLGGVGVAVVVGGPVGVAGGLLVAVLVPPWAARLPSAAQAREDREITDALPVVADLLAACLAAGAAPAAALTAVGTAVGGSAGELLRSTARHWQLTGSLAESFAADPRTAPGRPAAALAITWARSERSGAPVGPLLAALAGEQRDARRSAREAAARRVGVWAVLPLGACFLPAFLLAGVVPVVAGLVRQI